MSEPTELQPIIVGVGEINDRPGDGEPGLDSAELMAAALRAADADGGSGWLARCDAIEVVPQLSFAIDVSAELTRHTGIAVKRIYEAPIASGDTPVRLLNEAANAIATGKARVIAITGGEALRTAARRGGDGPLFKGSLKSASDLRRRYGLINPGEIYPLYENALRADWGQSLAEAQAESAAIWSAMSEVAGQAEGAWLKQPVTAEEVAAPSERNRPIAFPYTKLMVANSAVNQGAAVIVTSLAEARAAGIAGERLVYIGAGAAAHESGEPMERAEWTGTPSMKISIEEALKANGISSAEIDYLEAYSCFPCVPKMARRILDWPLDRPMTVHGGLTFGGGPVGNYMTHAIAAMVRALRRDGQLGLLFANGGHCSHNHTIVLGREPTAQFPQDFDRQPLADAKRGHIPPLSDDFEGAATLETYTIVYNRSGSPEYGVTLSRTDDGRRIVARVEPDDEQAIAFLTDGACEPVGHIGMHRKAGDTLHWQV